MESIGYWLATAFSALLGTVGVRIDESPAYEVQLRDGRHEVRQYAPMLVAETRDAGAPEAAANASFRRLAAYIFGDNQAGARVAMTAPVVMEAEKIAMTAPVTMQREGEQSVMRFVVPRRYSRDTVPRPNDPAVAIREWPGERLAVLRFSGTSTPQRWAACEAALRAWMSSRGLQAAGPARLANYDPPFAVPFLRCNELMIPVAGGE